MDRRSGVLLFLVSVLLLEYWMYFSNLGHFFQGDTLFWFTYRLTSLNEFWPTLVSLDPGGWYRPLTNRTVQSVFFPVWGLHPDNYRLVLFLVFAANTMAVRRLAQALSGSAIAAMTATVFFAAHSINAYTTYDIAFMPEQLYTLFYVCGVLAFLRHLQNGLSMAYWLSVTLFVGALLSKESAVTFPLMLIAFTFLLKTRSVKAITSLVWPHVAISATYVAFVVGYLGVAQPAFDTLMAGRPSGSDYQLIAGWNIVDNLWTAIVWAFNIPAGWHAQWRDLSSGMVGFLTVFAVAITLGALWLLWHRNLTVAIGCLWFVIAVLPPLPFFGHFLPYYLFLPIIGLSLVIGACFSRLFDTVKPRSMVAATLAVVLPLLAVVTICKRSVTNDARDNRLLGGSAKVAWNAVRDLHEQQPVISKGATLVIVDDSDPGISWDHGFGGLFRISLDDPSLHVGYGGDAIAAARELIAFAADRGRLLNVTQDFRQHPQAVRDAARATPVLLQIQPEKVPPETGAFDIRIERASNTYAIFQYFREDGPLQTLEADVDAGGTARIDKALMPPEGLFRFYRFRLWGESTWTRCDGYILIQTAE